MEVGGANQSEDAVGGRGGFAVDGTEGGKGGGVRAAKELVQRGTDAAAYDLGQAQGGEAEEAGLERVGREGGGERRGELGAAVGGRGRPGR